MRANVAVVAGGARGIGLGVVRGLLAEGRHVLILDQRKPPATAAAAEFRRLDLRNMDDLSAVANELRSAQLRIGGLAITAGKGTRSPNGDDAAADFREDIANNLDVVWNTLHALEPCLARHSSIVVISSISARAALRTSVGYCAGKAAVEGLVRYYALRLASRGIRVNAIAPGPVLTRLFQETTTAEDRKYLLQRTPLKRFAHVREVATTVQFLLSDSTAHITGEVITVDGGLSHAAAFHL